MRKVISLSFVAILLVNLFGYFISFSVQRNKIREEVRRTVKEEKLKRTQQFVFTEQEYQQLNKNENDKEFIFNGGLYDVVKKEFRGGKIVLTAYYDHQETGLLEQLISYFNDETRSEKGKQILPVFNLLEFIFHTEQWKCFDSLVFLNLPSYSSNLLSLFLDSVSPPPDQLFS